MGGGVSLLLSFLKKSANLIRRCRGCVAATSCGTTVTGTIIGVEYTSKYACCTTDLCNGASAVQLSLTAGLCAAILSSLWGFI
uniref:UPAR/Ly6 domain-containing protein n=1 Tax=Poecilia latipinna TaxID=48699 RepID=A0A3B3VG49_9TELE